jgi:molybdenum cofactor cytidylyltransferase
MGATSSSSFTTGLVLAAGSSRRLGQPKQLLEYRGRTLLDGTLAVARECRFDQLLVAIGGAADEVRSRVDFSGCSIVDNVHHTSGCASSIVAALDQVDPRSGRLVLMLGDQPGVDPSSVSILRERCEASDAAIGVCRYENGRGHPFCFDRSMFGALGELHGDKAVWKLLESDRWPVTEATVPGDVPLDVDTWDDYLELIGQDA